MASSAWPSSPALIRDRESGSRLFTTPLMAARDRVPGPAQIHLTGFVHGDRLASRSLRVESVAECFLLQDESNPGW
jgi:hypothetical protein